MVDIAMSGAAAGITKPSFAERVSNLLRRVEYRLALDPEEREAIFRQRYRAYLREQAIDPNDTGLFTDEYDLAENAQVYGLYIHDRLCASLRIHATSENCRALPAMWAFADILGPELDAGRIVVDPSRFVVDHEASREHPELAYVMARLGWIAGAHYRADLVLSTARAEHQAFYRRVFNYRLVADCRPYGTLKKKLSLLFLDYPEQRDAVEARLPFLRSTAAEREAIFGRVRPASGGQIRDSGCAKAAAGAART